jgi:uncharacterized protein (TIGR00369 family)
VEVLRQTLLATQSDTRTIAALAGHHEAPVPLKSARANAPAAAIFTRTRNPMTSTLEQWLAEEESAKTRLSNPAELASMTTEELLMLDGLAQMRAMLAGRARPPSISQTLDFFLLEVAPGRAVFQGTPGPAHLNPMGSVHGGWYATLLDSALGCSVQCALPAGKAYTTLELKVNIVRALTPQLGTTPQRVRAEGRVIHLGGQTATADARLVGPDGKLYAHGSTTCLVFDPRDRAAARQAPQSAA